MMMQMVGAFAEFERAMIRERTSAGLAAARAEGRIGGRRRKLDASKRREIAASVISGRRSGAMTYRRCLDGPASREPGQAGGGRVMALQLDAPRDATPPPNYPNRRNHETGTGDFTPTGFASHEASIRLADPTPSPVS
jgi:hypothetical protein